MNFNLTENPESLLESLYLSYASSTLEIQRLKEVINIKSKQLENEIAKNESLQRHLNSLIDSEECLKANNLELKTLSDEIKSRSNLRDNLLEKLDAHIRLIFDRIITITNDSNYYDPDLPKSGSLDLDIQLTKIADFVDILSIENKELKGLVKDSNQYMNEYRRKIDSIVLQKEREWKDKYKVLDESITLLGSKNIDLRSNNEQLYNKINELQATLIAYRSVDVYYKTLEYEKSFG